MTDLSALLPHLAHAPGSPRVLLLPPHPDDETLTGLLALRLLQEVPGTTVHVLPATYGSNPDRRAARRAELQNACDVLGFTLLPPPAAPDLPPLAPDRLAPLLADYDLVVTPHHLDGHPCHRRTCYLLRNALRLAALPSPPSVAETDYWMPNAAPNLLVGATDAQIALLQRALRCHVGEVARNDYDVRLPAWMSDSIRRASEWLPRPPGVPHGTPAFPPATIPYGTLYRLRPLPPRLPLIFP